MGCGEGRGSDGLRELLLRRVKMKGPVGVRQADTDFGRRGGEEGRVG